MIIMAGNPPMSPRSGKYMACRVHLLDGSMQIFHVPFKSMGQVLFDEVVRHVQLLEADYFDLEYMTVEKLAAWLDREKLILKQVAPNNLIFRFLVKFYTPDPVFLEDEYTRYLFALQIKQDLASGSLYCQEHTAVLLASYIVQAEMGDFVEEEYPDHSYLLDSHLLPNQTAEVLAKIMEHHREHVGFSPAEADFNLLDTARKVEFYGIRLHPARDHENVCLDLAVTHMGVLVFQNKVKINTFSWAKIRKLSFKRRKFLIKLHQEGYGFYKDTVEFYFDNRNGSKNFWKKCIEHHSFFRCHAVKRMPRHKTRVVSRGSSFRYTGRTQKQLVEWMRENYLKRPPFERSPDKLRRSATTGQVSSCSELHSHQQANRSTSLRTVSTSRSVGATPKTGTLNSRDFQPSRNTSASSGSHILDTRRSFENVRMGVDEHLAANPAMNSSLPLHQLDTASDLPPVSGALQLDVYDLSFSADIIESSHLLLMSQNANDNDDTSHDSYHLNESRDSLDGELDSDSDNCKQINKNDFLNQFHVVDKLYDDVLLNLEHQNTLDANINSNMLNSAYVVTTDCVDDNIAYKNENGTDQLCNFNQTSILGTVSKSERCCESQPTDNLMSVINTEDVIKDLAVVEQLFDKVIENNDNCPSADVEDSASCVPADSFEGDATCLPCMTRNNQGSNTLSADANDSVGSTVGGHLEKQETIKSLEDGEDLNNEIPYILHRRHISPVTNQRMPLKNYTLVHSSADRALPECVSDVLRQKPSIPLSDDLLSSSKCMRARSKSPSAHVKGTYDFVLRSKLPSRYSYSSRDDTFNGNLVPLKCDVGNEAKIVVDAADTSIGAADIDTSDNGKYANQDFSCSLLGDLSDSVENTASKDDVRNASIVCAVRSMCEANDVIISAEMECINYAERLPSQELSDICPVVAVDSYAPCTDILEINHCSAVAECVPGLLSSEQHLLVPDIIIRAATPLSPVCILETIPFIDDNIAPDQDSSTAATACCADTELNFEFAGDNAKKSGDTTKEFGVTAALCDVLFENELTSDTVNFQITEATLVQMKEICDISPSDSEHSMSSNDNGCLHLAEIIDEEMEPLAALESNSLDSMSSSHEEFDLQCGNAAVIRGCWEDDNCATDFVDNSLIIEERKVDELQALPTSPQLSEDVGVPNVLQDCDNKSTVIASERSDLPQCTEDNEASLCDLQWMRLNKMDDKIRRLKFAASRDSTQHYNLISENVDVSSGSSSEDNGSFAEESEPLEALENNISQHWSSDDDLPA